MSESEQESMFSAWKSGMGRAFRKVVPKPDPDTAAGSRTATPSHAGGGAAAEAARAAREAAARREREAGL